MTHARAVLRLAVLTGLLWAPAGAVAGFQEVRISDLKVLRTSKGYRVTGTVTGAGLNQVGVPESDVVQLLADFKIAADATYPELPDGLVIRPPKAAETSFAKDGRMLTRKELHGVNVKIVTFASVTLRAPTVWRRYGLKEWADKAPNTVTRKFEGLIPLEFGDKPVRLHARLRHHFGGPHAAWPGIVFRHSLWKIGGTLHEIAPIDVTDEKLGDPDILKLLEAIRRQEAHIARLETARKADEAALAKLQGKYDAIMAKASTMPDTGYAVGMGDFKPHELHIITNAGGGPSLLQDMCPVIGAQRYGKQVELMKKAVAAAKEIIAAEKGELAKLKQKLSAMKASKGQ